MTTEASNEVEQIRGRLAELAEDLDRRAHATGKAAEPAGWLRGWEANGVQMAIKVVDEYLT